MRFPSYDSNFDGIINFESLDYKNHYDFTETHRHNYYEMIFFNKGGGEQVIDFKKEKIRANQISFIYPGQIHSLKKSNKTRGVVVQFNKGVLGKENNLYSKLLAIESNTVLSEKKFNAMFSLIKFLMKRSETKGNFEREISISQLHLILYEILNLQKNENTPEAKVLSLRFTELLETNFYDCRLVKTYAEKLNVSTRQLNEILNLRLGKKALQLIHERIILEIKRMLLDEDLSLKEIAYRLNFDSQATFTRFVKKHTGQLPSELKSQVTEIHNF